MTWFMALVKLVTAWLELRVEQERLKLLRVKLDELEKINNEADKLEKNLTDLRRAGNDAAADLLLYRASLRASLRASAAAVVSVPPQG